LRGLLTTAISPVHRTLLAGLIGSEARGGSNRRPVDVEIARDLGVELVPQWKLALTNASTALLEGRLADCTRRRQIHQGRPTPPERRFRGFLAGYVLTTMVSPSTLLTSDAQCTLLAALIGPRIKGPVKAIWRKPLPHDR
jgi:hypothetical protein